MQIISKIFNVIQSFFNKNKKTFIFYSSSYRRFFANPSKRQNTRFEQTLNDNTNFFNSLNRALQNVEGNIIIDVGANVGYWTISFEKYMKREKYIFAIEPDSRNLSYLSYNLSECKNSQIFQTGFGKSIDNLSVGMPEYLNNRGGDHIINTGNLSVFHEDSNARNLRFTSGDNFVKSFVNEKDKILCIKIDVEGYEDDVIKGFTNTFNDYRPVIILEINPDTQTLADYNLHNVFSKFRELNYISLIPENIDFALDKRGFPNVSLNMILVQTSLKESFIEAMDYKTFKI